MIYSRCDIFMKNAKLIKAYIPMSETFYYILLSLNEPRHGYGIIRFVEELSGKRIRLGSGTVYGTLAKMQKDKIISVFSNQERKTIYKITEDGKELLRVEIERLKKLYADTLNQEGFFQS